MLKSSEYFWIDEIYYLFHLFLSTFYLFFLHFKIWVIFYFCCIVLYKQGEIYLGNNITLENNLLNLLQVLLFVLLYESLGYIIIQVFRLII